MSVQYGPLMLKAAQAPFVESETLCGRGSVLVLAPHPDDESLGCGAAIAAARAVGKRVHIAVITDGSKSHTRSKAYPAPALAALRRTELGEALRHLNIPETDVTWLGFADGAAPRGETLVETAGRLAELTDQLEASAVWTTWEGDPHRDHQATAELATCLTKMRPALLLWRYPIWGRFAANIRDLPNAEDIGLFDPLSTQVSKAQAIAAHRSQMTRLIFDDQDGFVMDTAMQQHFIHHPEIFIASNGIE